MEEKLYFVYGEKEIDFLKSRDKALGRLIDEVGHVYREVIPDMFMALLNSIIGQQISTKAQITVWERCQKMFAPLTPEHIHTLPAGEIKTCGISLKKAAYIKEIAANIVGGSLDLTELAVMNDEAVCTHLSQLKGIGVWTAEMLLIFSMQRGNVLSWDDLGIQRGIRMLYRHSKLTREQFGKYKKRYSPYATIAGLYLWELSAGRCKGYVDNFLKTEAQKNVSRKNKKSAGS